MDKTIIAAFVSSATAIVLAIWGLVTAYLSKSMALRAEEQSKRRELVRVKALEVIDALLDAIWDLMQMIRYFRGQIRYGGGVSQQDPETMKELETLTTRLTALGHLRLKSGPYLTAEIDSQLEKVLGLGRLEFEEAKLDEFENQLTNIAKSVSDFCRSEYLVTDRL